MITLSEYFMTILITCMIVNLGLALYGVFFKPNLIKKIIALTILGDTANTFALIIGYRMWVAGVPSRPPVFTEWRSNNPLLLLVFTKTAVDPLPQALVLTAIVIGLAVTLFLVFLTLQAWKIYRSIDMRDIKRLKG